VSGLYAVPPKKLLHADHSDRKTNAGDLPGRRVDSGYNQPKSAENSPKAASGAQMGKFRMF
jgi:hypothetical protein